MQFHYMNFFSIDFLVRATFLKIIIFSLKAIPLRFLIGIIATFLELAIIF